LDGGIFFFEASEAALADHVHDAGITVNAEGDRDDAKISCNATFVFEINGRVTDRTE
tara:strand:+ start:905 stop:1075 length:171 start_codon:yes stop_codon:yes gene_type:complete